MQARTSKLADKTEREHSLEMQGAAHLKNKWVSPIQPLQPVKDSQIKRNPGGKDLGH